jgi:hypothetical protein
MKFSPIIALTLFLSLLISSCKQHQEACRPISQTSGSFMKNQWKEIKLVAGEEDQIKN